jgi:hypothetical protein
MAIVRVGALVACTAALLLGACASSTFSADAPAGVSLAGTWKLDHAASDDPQKALAKMRDEANKLIKRHDAEVAARTGTAPQDVDAPAPDAGPSPGGPGAGAHAGAGQGGARHGDPLRRSPMAAIIHAMTERGDYLTVHQSASEFVLDYGAFRRTFTPGGHSVVSAEGGVGDQNSGWHHKSYVIHVKPQMGPEVTETYALSPDSEHLLDTLAIAASELPAVTIKRVYGRTTETAPPQLPSTD